MTNGLWKGSLLVLIILFHYTGKEGFQKSTPEMQMQVFGLAQVSHFWLWDIIPPLRVPASFSHILCKIWDHTYVQED